MDNSIKNYLDLLHSHGYGIEQRLDNKIDLYNDNTYLFVSTFDSFEELLEWTDKNIR